MEKRDSMRTLKKIVKWFVKVGLSVLVLLGGFTFYFWYVVDFHQKLSSNVQEKVLEHKIHPLVFSEIPFIYREAVISTEDRSFSWNPGIDPVGIFRSLVVDVGKASYAQGGSTVTQQLVDNTLIHREKSLRYKLTQAFYAFGIYVTFSKEQTFDMYANVIYFGHGAYGLYNASKTYFGKVPAQLNAGELTMLAGVPNAPKNYDPFKNMSLARQRQSIVLENMVDDHLISKQESAQIFDEPIRLKR
jgi:penicillin-binding protein 1A/penicillin-binding protein 2A